MTNIVTDLEQVIEKNEVTVSKSSKAKGYMEASKKFEELVEKGVVEKRGYTLLTTVEDATIKAPTHSITHSFYNM